MRRFGCWFWLGIVPTIILFLAVGYCNDWEFEFFKFTYCMIPAFCGSCLIGDSFADIREWNRKEEERVRKNKEELEQFQKKVHEEMERRQREQQSNNTGNNGGSNNN